MRVDKKKKLWKVAEELLNNPLATTREVSENTWVSKSTVANYINNDLDIKEIINNYEKQQKVLTTDFKQTIDEELLWRFITLCWSKIEATKQLEDFLLLSIEWNKKRRQKINWTTRYELLLKAWFKCQACWEKPNKDNDIVLHIDHIIPFNQWWLDVIENYQILCNKCNSSKSDDFNYNHNKNEKSR